MTATEERAALVRAVCESPGDDTPRLVFADWLDDHGESDRAEFVRAQVELANETRKTYRPKLERRIKNLLRGAVTFRRYPWVNEWLDGPPKCGITVSGWKYAVVPMEPRVYFSRGFVSQVTCTADVWLRHADAIAWRPGWEMACPECNGNGQVGTLGGTMGCVLCSKGPRDRGTGRVPRSFPPTAQPITGVVLTSLPEWETRPATVGGDRMCYEVRFAGRPLWHPRQIDQPAISALGLEWPGVAFDLYGDVARPAPGSLLRLPR